MRIAVVNDMPSPSKSSAGLCQGPGHTLAWVAVNGREAVEKCLQDRPDLILMDLIMPVMDGVQATGIIMKESPARSSS